MVSSARNAWSSIVVIDGMRSTVDASTPRPTSAPSRRSHTGVNRLEYSGNRIVREASSSRSVVHACQPMRLRTGCRPSRSPMARSRTAIDDEPGEDDAGDERGRHQPRERAAARPRRACSSPAMPAAITAPPAAKAAIGSSERRSDEAP